MYNSVSIGINSICDFLQNLEIKAFNSYTKHENYLTHSVHAVDVGSQKEEKK